VSRKKKSDRETSVSCKWEGEAEELVLDSIRSLAEACDFTDSIDLFVSLLSADKVSHPQKLIELIRDDFGSSVAVPLFVMVSAGSAAENALSQSVFSEVARSAALQSILVDCSESASLIAPIHVGGVDSTADAIDTLLSFRLAPPSSSPATGRQLSSRDWASACTGNGRFPVVFLEATCDAQSLSSAFDSLQSLSDRPAAPRSAARNPFLASFAPQVAAVWSKSRAAKVAYGDESDVSDEESDVEYNGEGQRAYEKPLSNVLAVRSEAVQWKGEDLATSLFLQCINSPYRLSSVSLAPGLPASVKPPPQRAQGDLDVGRGLHSYNQRRAMRQEESEGDAAADPRFQFLAASASVSAAAAAADVHRDDVDVNSFVAASLGASVDVGRYVGVQRRHWHQALSSGSSSLALRLRLLDFLQYEADDVERVSASLLSLSEQYLSSA
jgi:hypothetical protein